MTFWTGALLALATLPALLVLSGGTARGDANVERGKELSLKHCARCHVVGDFNRNGGIGSTPSFQLLVKRRPDWRHRFRTFFSRRPHPAFVIIKGYERLMEELPPAVAPVILPESALADIEAFAATLQEGGKKPKASESE